MSASIYFNGSSWMNLSLPAANLLAPTGDFTLEMFAYFLVDNQDQTLWDSRPTATNGAYIRLSRTATNIIALYVNAATRITGTIVLATDTWYHIALARSNGTTKLFINGTEDGSWADSTVYLNPIDRPRIGARGSDNTFDRLTGYLSNIRFDESMALYTSNFTKPNQALVSVSSTTTLLLANENPLYDPNIKDNSGAYAITVSRSNNDMYLASNGPFSPEGSLGTGIINSEDFNYEVDYYNLSSWNNSTPGFIYR